jgi:hypothetical protein
VTEDVGVGAAGLYQGVGEDGQAVEGPLVVDGLGQPGNRAVIPGQPGWFNGHRAKRVAEEVSQNFTLQDPLGLLLGFQFRLRPVVVIFKVFDNPISQSVDVTERQLCLVMRDIFGNPFRPLPPLPPSVLGWHGGLVVQLALAAYEQRSLPAGTLEPDRLAVLADALEDAGCQDDEIVGHLRGPGPHVRGCNVIDLLTGRR